MADAIRNYIHVKTGRGAFVSGKSSSDSIYCKLFKS